MCGGKITFPSEITLFDGNPRSFYFNRGSEACLLADAFWRSCNSPISTLKWVVDKSSGGETD